MASKQRFTKKMLDPLDRAELRKIAIVGMGLEPLDAYTMKEPDVISWIHERAEEFSQISLTSVGEDTFRPGVASYIAQLQEFVLGKRTAPKFPPEDGEAPAQEELAVEEPVKRKRGRPRKEDAAKSSTKKPEAKKAESLKDETTEDAPKRKRGRPRKSETAAKFKKVEAPVIVEAVVTKAPMDSFDKGVDFAAAAFLEKVSQQAERISSLESNLQAMRQEQTDGFNLINNAIVFLVNTLVIEADDPMIRDLMKIPNPEKYVPAVEKKKK